MSKPEQARFTGNGYAPTTAGPKIPPRGGSALPPAPAPAQPKK